MQLLQTIRDVLLCVGLGDYRDSHSKVLVANKWEDGRESWSAGRIPWGEAPESQESAASTLVLGRDNDDDFDSDSDGASN